MTFARLDRALTRIWLGLAACLVLAGGAAPRRLRRRDPTVSGRGSPLRHPRSGRTGSPGDASLIHRDPGTIGNLRQARP